LFDCLQEPADQPKPQQQEAFGITDSSSSERIENQESLALDAAVLDEKAVEQQQEDPGIALQKQLDELRKRLIKKGLGLYVSPAAKQIMLEQGYDAKNGVRPMRRLIQDEIEDHIAGGLLDEVYQNGDVVSVGVSKNGLSYSLKSEKPVKTKK